MHNFEIIDVNMELYKVNSPISAVRITVDPPDCFIAAGSFSRGLFLCKNLETPVSSYILMPDGSTKYAFELISSKNPVKELFGFKNNEKVACSLEEAVEVSVNPDSVIEYKCNEPTKPDSPYWKILRMKEIYYVLVCTEKTEVIPKLVKSESKGTHFGTRINGDSYTCLEL